MKQLGPLSETDVAFIDDANIRDYVRMFEHLISFILRAYLWSFFIFFSEFNDMK